MCIIMNLSGTEQWLKEYIETINELLHLILFYPFITKVVFLFLPPLLGGIKFRLDTDVNLFCHLSLFLPAFHPTLCPSLSPSSIALRSRVPAESLLYTARPSSSHPFLSLSFCPSGIISSLSLTYSY